MANPYGFTAADVLARFSETELTQLTDGADTFDEEKVDQAIRDGCAEFDGAASRYYMTPISPLSEWVRTILLDLIAWRLIFNCKREWLNTDQQDALAWTARRKEIVAWLAGLQSPDRKIVLADVAERIAPATKNALPKAVGAGGRLTRRRLLRHA
jgi:phage gp36-like protein